jgi:hypothetical protein
VDAPRVEREARANLVEDGAEILHLAVTRGHLHWLKREQQHHLCMMLRGFYQYFGLHHCTRKLSWLRYAVQRQWDGALLRCSERHRLTRQYLASRPWFELPSGRLLHPLREVLP